MPVPPLGLDGLLPLGRWVATPDEVHAEFVAGKSAARQQVWSDWLQLTEALREVVRVPAAWMSGSLLSSKDAPGDVDSVYLIEWRHLTAARSDRAVAQFLQVVAASKAKDILNLSVDSFILEWAPVAGTLRTALSGSYFEDRGYWDDLWTRQRSSDLRLGAIPRRGYLEVILDGYS